MSDDTKISTEIGIRVSIKISTDRKSELVLKFLLIGNQS